MNEIFTGETFLAMLHRVLGDRLDPSATTFADMFAEDGVLEYPFAPVGLQATHTGREAIIANFERVRKLLTVTSVSDVVVYRTDNPDLMTVEFSAKGQGVVTKQPYDQRYVSVIKLSDGHIDHYKDYWNPLVLLRTLNGAGATEALAIG